MTSIVPGIGLTGTSSDDAITTSGTINLKTASTDEIGGIKTGYTENGKNYKVQTDTNGNAYVNVPWTSVEEFDDSKYIPILTSEDLTLLDFDENGNGEYTYSIKLPKNRIFFYDGDKAIIYSKYSPLSILTQLYKGNFYITRTSDYYAYDENGNRHVLVYAEPINLNYQTDGYNKLSYQTLSGSSSNYQIDYSKDTIIINYAGDNKNPVLKINYLNDDIHIGKNIKVFYFNMITENITLILKSDNSTGYVVSNETTEYTIKPNEFIFLDLYIIENKILVVPSFNIIGLPNK